MARHRLSDAEWMLIAELFPRAKTGRPPLDFRQAFDGICWILRTGAPWRDLPEAEFGPWETVYGAYNRWTSNGVLEHVLAVLKDHFSAQDGFDHSLWNIDGTITRAHRCANGGGKKTIQPSPPTTPSATRAAGIRRRSTSSAMDKAPR